MRVFLGVPISQDIVPRIARFQKRFSGSDIKLVEEDNFHFNLRFFGEIEDKIIDKLRETVKETCSSFEKFDINISGVGAFPSKNYIRVIWLGVKDGHNELVGLANTLNNAIERLGFEKETESFVPHLTLGRVRSGKNKEKLISLVKEAENEEIGFMRVERVVLFQSKLSPKGPVYEEVFSIEL